jgi:hypothetical protein
MNNLNNVTDNIILIIFIISYNRQFKFDKIRKSKLPNCKLIINSSILSFLIK